MRKLITKHRLRVFHQPRWRDALRWWAWTCLLGAGVVTGCGPSGPIYRDAGGIIPSSVTPKANWVASGDPQRPAAAIDGDVTTAAATTGSYVGQALTIDLTKACLFQMVVVEHGSQEQGFAGSVEVAVSTDGQSFQTEYTVPGTRRVTIICLPQPTLARYIRLRVLRPGPAPWHLAEIYIR